MFIKLLNDCICLFVLIHVHMIAGSSKRRPLLLGVGALALSLIPVNSVLAEGIMVGSLSLFKDLIDHRSEIHMSNH